MATKYEHTTPMKKVRKITELPPNKAPRGGRWYVPQKWQGQIVQRAYWMAPDETAEPGPDASFRRIEDQTVSWTDPKRFRYFKVETQWVNHSVKADPMPEDI